jgi:hypothetical protein
MLHDLHLPHSHYIESWAIFSKDRCYRQLLRRRWADGPLVGFLGLNPSTASEHREDSTSRRFKGFAEKWGYSGYTAGNLYDAASTDPKRLTAMDVPVSGDNDRHLGWLAATHDMIVFAWGGNADPDRARAVASNVWHQCRQRGGTVAVLGWTGNDQPRHPLYLASDTPLQTLTASGHPGFVDVDPRWSRLLADTTGLSGDTTAAPVTVGEHRWSA